MKKVPVASPQNNFVAIENKQLDRWSRTSVVNKYLHRNDKSAKRFSFLDGPITANNPMGVHHAWGRTLKDCIQRYKNMNGYRQRFQNGFDNQGLWVEVEVEKELGFKNKKDIESYGIDKFVNKCKERTLKSANTQTEQSKRLGYFMDWDNSYYTMSDANNYMIWHFLKKCWQSGLLYKGRDSVPWCPRCGTAISQHEILTEEYQEITHDSIYFKLPLSGQKNIFFLVWTTTPWTLPANVALAVNPELTYAYFRQDNGDTLIVAEKLAAAVLGASRKKIKTVSGSRLAGMTYSGPFDELPLVKKARADNPATFHTVVLDKDLVTADEGTGIVHLAPGAGQEDFQIGKRENLPLLAIINESADYLPGLGELSAKNAKKDPSLIFSYLEKKTTATFKIAGYRHRYPVCWRCKTELVWRVVDEWYISMGPKRGDPAWHKQVLRERMERVARKIHWIPDFGLKREIDWLRNMDDWLISKKRYWGLALPIWECPSGHFQVIGSRQELRQTAISGWKEFSPHTPHRPWVDRIKIKCQTCGQTASRIPDVGNPWLDAGIVPFSTLVDHDGKVSYTTDKKYWRQWFPADFVTESFPGQFKNWFYSLIAMSTVLEDRPPFVTLLGHALVNDEKGEIMHKSKGNSIEFNDAAEKMGADVMRWMYLSQNPSQNVLFGYKAGDETRRRFHLLLWNTFNFFTSYASVDGWKQSKACPSVHILDRWITARLQEMIYCVSNHLENYHTPSAAQTIESFIADFSLWYIRRSRDRVGPSQPDSDDKMSAYYTMHQVLEKTVLVLAPFIPFLAEEIYTSLTGKLSVHLADWPQKAPLNKVQIRLIREMSLVRQICEIGHRSRKELGIKVRQPLALAMVAGVKNKLSAPLSNLIKEELNIKKLSWIKPEAKNICVKYRSAITTRLKKEGELRELVRQIQELRKTSACPLDARIKVFLSRVPADAGSQSYIKQKTLAIALIPGPELKISLVKK